MLKIEYNNFWNYLYWCFYLGVLTSTLGMLPLSNTWFIFVLPSMWIINYCVDKLYDYLRGDLILLI
jgi:hypothetical protein